MRGGDGKEKKNAPEKDKRTKLRKTREKRKNKNTDKVCRPTNFQCSLVADFVIA